MEQLKGLTKGLEKFSAVGVLGSMGSKFGFYSQKQENEDKDSSQASNIEYVDEMRNDDHFVPRYYPDLEDEFVNAVAPPATQDYIDVPVVSDTRRHNIVSSNIVSPSIVSAQNISFSEEEDDFLVIESAKIAPTCNYYYLPFVQSLEMCNRLVQNWLQQIWFLPSDWRVSLKISTPKPQYVPFFVFNVKTSTQYEASVQVESKDPASPRRKWEPAVGELTSKYEEILACASCSVNLKLIQRLIEQSGFSYHTQRVLPTDPRVFQASSLEGTEEEVLPFEMAKEDAWELYGKPRILEWEEQKARELLKQNYELAANTQIRELSVEPTFLRNDYFVILLPIYFTGFEHAGTTYEVLVSGNLGVVVGNRPVGTGSGGKYILDKIKSVGNLVTDTVPL